MTHILYEKDKNSVTTPGYKYSRLILQNQSSLSSAAKLDRGLDQ